MIHFHYDIISGTNDCPEDLWKCMEQASATATQVTSSLRVSRSVEDWRKYSLSPQEVQQRRTLQLPAGGRKEHLQENVWIMREIPKVTDVVYSCIETLNQLCTNIQSWTNKIAAVPAAAAAPDESWILFRL